MKLKISMSILALGCVFALTTAPTSAATIQAPPICEELDVWPCVPREH